MAKIHPTAFVDPGAQLADSVEIGPYCIVESDVVIGGGTVLRSHAVVRKHTTLGENNFLDSFVVLGGEPQDYDFDPNMKTHVKIGNDNVFREYVSINRATGEGNSTVVGNKTYWMSHSHAGHNAQVSDGVIFAHGAGLGGYAKVGRKVILSGGVHVHQFTWVGDYVMTQGHAGISCHVPPYCIVASINILAGLNKIGVRRSEEIAEQDYHEISEAFSITYRSKLSRKALLAKLDECEFGEPASKFRDFIHAVHEAESPYNRGLCKMGRR